MEKDKGLGGCVYFHETQRLAPLPSPPSPFTPISFDIDYYYSSWKKKHKMQHLAALSHSPEVEAARVSTRQLHVREIAAQEAQRERLRDTSVVEGHRQHFEENWLSFSSRPAISTPPQPTDPTATPPDRLELVARRLAQKGPLRFATDDWAGWRDESIALLQGAYPNTGLRALYDWLVDHSHPKGHRRLSASAIWEHVRQAWPLTEISSLPELRDVLKCLSFHWSNLHSSYYVLVHQRPDVKLHRSLYLPYALLCHEDERIFFAFADGSFLHENDIAEHAWCARAEENGDMIESNVGAGRRLNVFEFMTKHGIVRHPDGKSAGTLFLPNEIQRSDEFLVALRRGCEAIQAASKAKGCLVSALVIDGARTQKTMPSDAINPNKMNLHDGGKNREPMRIIGMKGCRTVLEEQLGEAKVKGMSLDQMRQLLWEWRPVLAQLTEAEELCLQYGIVLIYNPKGHPVTSAIEEFWRLAKFTIQDLLDLDSILNAYLSLVERYMAPGPDEQAHINKWFARSKMYLQYYGGGGEKFIRRSEMTPEFLSTQPPNRVVRAPLQGLMQLSAEIHKVNIILLQGKKYPVNPQPWGKE